MASPILRRALLYVPSSSSKMLQKSLTLPPTDTICYDLEDSVTPQNKGPARDALSSHLSNLSSQSHKATSIAARINDVSTGLALSDLTSLLTPSSAPSLDTIVVPKVNSASDLHFITDILRHLLPARHSSTTSANSDQKPIQILALIESAQAIVNLPSICAASPYLKGLIFAAEDFSHDLSLTRTPSLSEFLYARSAIVTHARAFNLPSCIDLVCTSYKSSPNSSSSSDGLDRLREECENGKNMGFNGKQCIHPSQVAVVQQAFAPSEKEVEWSVRVVVADEKAKEGGRGAWTLEGKMIDLPVVRRAREVVGRAERCGVDVQRVREEWKTQEPE